MTDITPQLLRMAVSEVLADRGASVATVGVIAAEVGLAPETIRVWLSRPGLTSPNSAHINWLIARFLADDETRQRAAGTWVGPGAIPATPKRPKRARRHAPEGMRVCPRCEQTLPLTAFASNGYCKPCNTAKRAEYQQQSDAAKSGTLPTCVRCGDPVRPLKKARDGYCARCVSFVDRVYGKASA